MQQHPPASKQSKRKFNNKAIRLWLNRYLTNPTKRQKLKGYGLTYCGYNPKLWCLTITKNGAFRTVSDYMMPHLLYNHLLLKL